jgi:hypothetical protein
MVYYRYPHQKVEKHFPDIHVRASSLWNCSGGRGSGRPQRQADFARRKRAVSSVTCSKNGTFYCGIVSRGTTFEEDARIWQTARNAPGIRKKYWRTSWKKKPPYW